MPWSDNSDSGSKPGGKPGPWGAPPPSGGGRGPDGDDNQRPRGGGPRRPSPPPEDLSAALRRLRRLLEPVFGPPGRGLQPRVIGAIVGLVAALWLLSGWYVVSPSEQAVVTTFGAWTRTDGPGLRYHLPGPIENVQKVQVTSLNQINIGGGDDQTASLMLTGDQNIVDLDFAVQWRINDAGKYLFQVKDTDDAVKAVAESAIREVVGKTALTTILTTGRGTVQDQTRDLMQHILDGYQAGVTVVDVQVIAANPPREVIPDFQAVTSAGEYADSAVNEARTYENKVVNEAKGDAAKAVAAAQAYREQVVLEAQGDAARFNQLDSEYRRAPEVTRERLYLETMQRVLSKSNKVIVDTKGSNAPIILPPDMFRAREAAAPAPDAGTQDAARLAKPGRRRATGGQPMNRNLMVGWLAVVFVAGVVLANTFYVVKQTDQAIVLRLGQAVGVINAAGEDDPGLKVKIPFIENVIALDKRNQALDAGQEEILASDQERLVVDGFIRYRIVDPLQYYRTLGDVDEVAHDRMDRLVNASLRQVLGSATADDIISGRRSALMAQARDEVATEAKAARLGIQIIDLRIKRADLPDTIRAAVYRRMQTARQQEAAQARALGEQKKREIMADADKQVAITLATAHEEAETTRGEGDNKRAILFASSFGKDPKFAAFYRSMQAYEAALGQGDTTMVLSPDSDFFKYFKNGPGK